MKFDDFSKWLKSYKNTDKKLKLKINIFKRFYMSTSLASLTKLKVQQLYLQSFIRLVDNKKDIFFISHKNGIHTYDISNNKI